MAGWPLVAAAFLCASAVQCVPVEQTTAATAITEPGHSFGQPGADGEVGLPVSEDGVSSNAVRRRNGAESAEENRIEPTTRERLVMQRLGVRCSGGDILSCFMVELTDYFDGFMARSNVNLLPGVNLTQVWPQQPLNSSEEEPAATSRSDGDSGPSLLQLIGRKVWAFARSHVLSLDLRPVADFVQEARTRGFLRSLEQAIGAGVCVRNTRNGFPGTHIYPYYCTYP
ncbi:uncharacterized protein LOC124606369 [Schistocerca americana]|uniref:uncharacterized protein LOC124606369 n=1 Tax=Schistocerca americana TaxID=7009 RepID=UPI001F4FBD4F|nr:uncharacterized protein LOC124606369 [Schistocerca americana]